MRCGIAILLALASLVSAADKKPKPAKTPDVRVVEIRCQRTESRVTVDGSVRIGGRKTLERLTLFFDFLATDNQVITTRRNDYPDEVMSPGQDVDFNLYLPDPVRAVYVVVRAEQKDGRELRVENAGPFPIY
jgi:hypothetical protein